jgi:hypothetical protein
MARIPKLRTNELRVLTDWDSAKIWYSREINHGDWPFRFMLKLEYPETWDAEAVKQYGKYYLTIHAVSPEAAKQTDAYQFAVSQGWMANIPADARNLAEYGALLSQGTSARLWEASGNNLSKLLRDARKELKICDLMFGFTMDRAQNAIGATGWDWIAGDVCGDLNREVSRVGQ